MAKEKTEAAADDYSKQVKAHHDTFTDAFKNPDKTERAAALDKLLATVTSNQLTVPFILHAADVTIAKGDKLATSPVLQFLLENLTPEQLGKAVVALVEPGEQNALQAKTMIFLLNSGKVPAGHITAALIRNIQAGVFTTLDPLLSKASKDDLGTALVAAVTNTDKFRRIVSTFDLSRFPDSSFGDALTALVSKDANNHEGDAMVMNTLLRTGKFSAEQLGTALATAASNNKTGCVGSLLYYSARQDDLSKKIMDDDVRAVLATVEGLDLPPLLRQPWQKPVAPVAELLTAHLEGREPSAHGTPATPPKIPASSGIQRSAPAGWGKQSTRSFSTYTAYAARGTMPGGIPTQNDYQAARAVATLARKTAKPNPAAVVIAGAAAVSALVGLVLAPLVIKVNERGIKR